MKPTLHKRIEAGFALPIAVGVGVIMILLATTMIIRSNQSQVASLTQRSSNKSLAAAESSVSQLIALFNKYRVFTTRESSEWETLRNTIQSLPGCGSYAQSPTKNPDSSNFDSEAHILDELIANLNNEIPVIPQDPAQAKDPAKDKGSYQLKAFSIASGTGILDILGKAEGGDGKSLTDLSVEFPIDETPIAHTEANNTPETCGELALSLAAHAEETIPLSFSSLEAKITSSSSANKSILSSDLKNQSLPLAGDPDGTTYIIGDDLSFSPGEKISVKDNQTAFLVTQDGFSITGEESIDIGVGGRLFIISYDNITIEGSNSKEPIKYQNIGLESAYQIPLYFYLIGPGKLTITTDNIQNIPDIPVVAYAPIGTVELNLNNNTTASGFKGDVWANSFQTKKSGTADTSTFISLTEENPTDANYDPMRSAKNFPIDSSFWENRLNLNQITTNKIRPINSWQRTRN